MFTNNYLIISRTQIGTSSYSGTYTYIAPAITGNSSIGYFTDSTGTSRTRISGYQTANGSYNEFANFANRLNFTVEPTNIMNDGNFNSRIVFLVGYKDVLSENDYELITANYTKVSVSRNSTSGEYSITVTNNTSSNFILPLYSISDLSLYPKQFFPKN